MGIFRKRKFRPAALDATGWIDLKLDEIKVNLDSLDGISDENKVSDEDINAIRSQIKEIQNFIGNKDSEFVDYSDIISKILLLENSIGDLTTLTTADKSSLVNAVNELVTQIEGIIATNIPVLINFTLNIDKPLLPVPAGRSYTDFTDWMAESDSLYEKDVNNQTILKPKQGIVLTELEYADFSSSFDILLGTINAQDSVELYAVFYPTLLDAENDTNWVQERIGGFELNSNDSDNIKEVTIKHRYKDFDNPFIRIAIERGSGTFDSGIRKNSFLKTGVNPQATVKFEFIGFEDIPNDTDVTGINGKEVINNLNEQVGDKVNKDETFTTIENHFVSSEDNIGIKKEYTNPAEEDINGVHSISLEIEKIGSLYSSRLFLLNSSGNPVKQVSNNPTDILQKQVIQDLILESGEYKVDKITEFNTMKNEIFSDNNKFEFSKSFIGTNDEDDNGVHNLNLNLRIYNSMLEALLVAKDSNGDDVDYNSSRPNSLVTYKMLQDKIDGIVPPTGNIIKNILSNKTGASSVHSLSEPLTNYMFISIHFAEDDISGDDSYLIPVESLLRTSTFEQFTTRAVRGIYYQSSNNSLHFDTFYMRQVYGYK